MRELFGDRVESLEMTRGEYVERAESPRAYRELFKQTFGPVVATYASLADQPDQPDRLAALLTESNTEFVQDLYETSARGDMEAFFAALSDDIEWHEAEGGPYGGVHRGPDEVAAATGRACADQQAAATARLGRRQPGRTSRSPVPLRQRLA